MTQRAVENLEHSGIGETIATMAAQDGSAGHRYPGSEQLATNSFAGRNLADVVHYLCVLHGGHPGVIDLAAEKTAEPVVRDWLRRATDGFGRERLLLSHLVTAAGPQPSTSGHTESENAVLGQRHAIETLARSERRGCAFGAAIALILDWPAIRAVLDTAAERMSVEAPLSALPNREISLAAVDVLSDSPAVGRAIRFGAEQMLLQHRGLWDLLEAREAAREDW